MDRKTAAHIPRMTNTQRKRQPRGTTTGGQFATESKNEAGISLNGAPHSASDRESFGKFLDVLSSPDGQDLYEVAEELYPELDDNVREEEFVHALARLYSEGRTLALEDQDVQAVFDKVSRIASDERKWRSHPTFKEPAGGSVSEQSSPDSPVAYTEFAGSKYKAENSASDIKKGITGDLKEALEAGYLPSGSEVKTRVSTVGGVPRATVEVVSLGYIEPYQDAENDIWLYSEVSPQAQVARERILAIANQYAHSNSDNIGEYYSTNLIVHVNFPAVNDPRSKFAA